MAQRPRRPMQSSGSGTSKSTGRPESSGAGVPMCSWLLLLRLFRLLIGNVETRLALQKLNALFLAGCGDENVLFGKIGDSRVDEHLPGSADALRGIAVVDGPRVLGGGFEFQLLGGEGDDRRV